MSCTTLMLPSQAPSRAYDGAQSDSEEGGGLSADDAAFHVLEALYNFKTFYESCHRYLSLFLCMAGCLANLVHIAVLVRPNMRRSSVHATLTCVAVVDIGTMLSYLVYIMRFEFFTDTRGYSYAWVEFLCFHAVGSVALHAISLYLVVFMAFIRLTALRIGQSKWMMPRNAYVISLFTAVIIITACIPTFLAHEIYENDAPTEAEDASPADLHSIPQSVIESLLQSLGAEHRRPPRGWSRHSYYSDSSVQKHRSAAADTAADDSAALWLEIRRSLARHHVSATRLKRYKVGFSERFLRGNCALLRLNLWFTGIFLKAIPCFLLLWFTFALLRKLRKNERKRRQLFNKEYAPIGLTIGGTSTAATLSAAASARASPLPPFDASAECGGSVSAAIASGATAPHRSRGNRKMSRAADRTTYILLLMLIVFIMTELPQGLFAVLNALFTTRFHSYVYMSIADVLDLLSLINCHSAFTVYMCTSTTYRQTLARLIGSLFARQSDPKLSNMGKNPSRYSYSSKNYGDV